MMLHYWKCLNASDPWSCVKYLLDHWDIPSEDQKVIIALCLPRKIPPAPQVVSFRRVRSSIFENKTIGEIYCRSIEQGEEPGYYDVAMTTINPVYGGRAKQVMAKVHYIRDLKFSRPYDIARLATYSPPVVIPSSFWKDWPIPRKDFPYYDSPPSEVRKLEGWAEFRHFVHFSDLDLHSREYSTARAHSRFVSKFGSRQNANTYKECEQTRIYKNLGPWRKYELAEAYPTLYGVDGWAKKLPKKICKVCKREK